MKPQAVTSLDDPLSHLVACHRRIEERLATLERVAEHMEEDRAAGLAALRNCNAFFASNGAWHSADEEESVFPRLLPRLDANERSFLSGLEAQHDEAEGLHERLVLLTGTPEAGEAWLAELRTVIARLVELYRGHIAVEDDLLMRLAHTHLTPDDLRAAAEEMKRRRGHA